MAEIKGANQIGSFKTWGNHPQLQIDKLGLLTWTLPAVGLVVTLQAIWLVVTLHTVVVMLQAMVTSSNYMPEIS